MYKVLSCLTEQHDYRLVLLAAIIQWALVFDPTRILANYHRITLIHRLTSLGFLGFLSAHIWGIL